MKLWERLDTGVSFGRNNFVRFGVRLLSIVTNSASCERAFSEFGITHTKRRNRLSEEKVHKSTMVKMDLRCDQAELGWLPTRKRRHFSHFEPPATPTIPSAPSSTSAGFSDADARASDIDDTDTEDASQSFTQLIHEIIAADLPGTTGDESPASDTGGTPTLIQLKDLFDYTVSIDADCWNGGFRALDEEMALYDFNTSTSDIS